MIDASKSENMRHRHENRQWHVVDSDREELYEVVDSVRAMVRNKTGVVPGEAYPGMEMHTDYSYLRAHCFGLEWIGCQIMNIDAFVDKLQALIGEDDDASYCVGTRKEQHGMRYVAVVRTRKKFSIRSARKVFVPYEICHGKTNESYKFGFRIVLPKLADDASLNGFVAKTLELMTMCTRYTLKNGQFLLQH